ncbi:MAG TPA: ABC transporter ATP-binding protein [Pirellulaceae bacterium]|nr:ABC transporter ATP-binding protein [Pirellulaceae bacterium]
MSAAIRLDQVTKRFGSQLALDQVSLEVAPGTVFALLGENGAGKSTTIRLLLGLAEPDSGHASVFGMESVKHSLEIRRCVGYVAERPTLYDWMTVDEIGWFAAGFYGGEFLSTYRKLIEQFALPSNKKIKALSKGMRAKVALALAMGHDPDLLILDEPTSGLDTMVRREFLESMVDRAASGKTVFLSSHQIHEVERVADIVGIMRQGKLIVVERLEKLKAEVQELTITLSDASAVPPLVAGELLRQRRRARQWQLLVRNGERESLQQLSEHASVEHVDVRTPSLEEIFVAYMRNEGGSSTSEAIEPSVPNGLAPFGTKD